MDIYIPRTPHRTSWTPRSRASERSSGDRPSEQLYKKDSESNRAESSRGVPSTRPTAITDQRRSLYYASAEYPTDGDGSSSGDRRIPVSFTSGLLQVRVLPEGVQEPGGGPSYFTTEGGGATSRHR